MPRFECPCREVVFALFRGAWRRFPDPASALGLSASLPLALEAIEQSRLQLAGHAPVDGPMEAIVCSVDKAWIALRKERPRLVTTAGEAPLLPNFVEPSRIAAVAQQEILAPHAKPPGNPDVDRIGLRQGTLDAAVGRCLGRCMHGAILTASEHRPFCAGKDSEVMAARHCRATCHRICRHAR